MAKPHPPEPALFFVAVLAADVVFLNIARDRIHDRFGAWCLDSLPVPFTVTEYYRDELGPQPCRALFGFDQPYHQERLAGDKLATNEMEKAIASACPGQYSRPVNLDPGCITLSKVILASAKDYSHRIYIGQGIFAEVTMQFRQGRLHHLPWTFPDYASGIYDSFFLSLRRLLRKKIDSGEAATP